MSDRRLVVVGGSDLGGLEQHRSAATDSGTLHSDAEAEFEPSTKLLGVRAAIAIHQT